MIQTQTFMQLQVGMDIQTTINNSFPQLSCMGDLMWDLDVLDLQMHTGAGPTTCR